MHHPSLPAPPACWSRLVGAGVLVALLIALPASSSHAASGPDASPRPAAQPAPSAAAPAVQHDDEKNHKGKDEQDDDALASGLDEALTEGTASAAAGKRPAAATLSTADLPEAMAVLRDYRPDLVERFEGWASRHPQQAAQMLSRSVPVMGRLIKMRRDDRQGYDLAIKDLKYFRATTIASQQLRQARQDNDEARTSELSERLRTLLSQHFDVRQQIRERDIQKLQQRLEQLRGQLSQRQEARSRILERRFEQLSDPHEKAAW